jgi:hypothetical protein
MKDYAWVEEKLGLGAARIVHMANYHNQRDQIVASSSLDRVYMPSMPTYKSLH